MAAGTQIFVRNREGKVFGPIEPSTVELLIEGGILQGLLQVSTDGEAYALPYRFPQIRDFFPRHLWGDDDRRDVQLDGDSPSRLADGEANAPPAVSVTSRPAPPGGPPTLSATELSSPSPPPPSPALRAPGPAVLPDAPVLDAAALEASPFGAPMIAPAAPTTIAPAGAPGRSPTGDLPRPPVLTAAPVGQAAAGVPTLSPDEPWAEAVPFELAPPGAPKPPPRTAAPVTSTFSVLRADFDETNALKIYVQGARAGATGLFFFDLEDRTTTLYMRRGNPESAESTHPSDAIGAFLVAQRLATPEQVTRAEGEASKFGNDVLAALFTLGVVNPGLVFPALAQRAADILLHAYLAPKGSFRFEPLELPASKVVPLGNRWGLLAEVIRRVPLPQLKARLMDVRERPVVRRGAGEALPDLRLTAQETRAMGYFDGTRSLAHLAQSNAGEMDTVLRVALLLRELDAVSFPEVALRPTPQPQPARPANPQLPVAAPAPPPPAAPAMTDAELANLPQADPPRIAPMAPPPASRPAAVAATFAAQLRELQARLERTRKENHFQILGVPETADSSTVRAAYFKLAKQFHPDTVPPEAPPDLARAKAEFFTAVGEANRVLSDDASRARYRETLASGGPAEVDVQAVLAAEETFNKGTALVRARRFPEAVKAFDDAIATNPREGEFYAWRGYARFFTLQDKKVAMVEALRDLNHSLKLNERCAPAHYFIGQLYKLTGVPETALKHFKRCVALDPQHVNAQREIRIASQK